MLPFILKNECTGTVTSRILNVVGLQLRQEKLERLLQNQNISRQVYKYDEWAFPGERMGKILEAELL